MVIKGRVLHLIDTGGPGGAETIFLELVRRLPAHGWQSVPIVPEIDWLARSLEALDIHAAELRARRSLDVGYLRQLRRLLLRERIDLVQTHLLGTGFYSALACLGTGIPVVSTLHGRPDIPLYERFRRIKVRLLRRNQIVCVSESLRRHYMALGDFREESAVIPNGVDLRSFVPGRRCALRSELGLADDVPLIGAVGNIRRSKAYDVLLEAFKLVRDAVPEAHLVIAGQHAGEAYQQLKAIQERLGVRECSHFLGFREDVAEVLGALDVFALSSIDEGFSLATVQAMAMGLPVVATRSGGPEEIVRDSRSAILVAPNDPVALADAIVLAFEDRELAASLGRTARRHVLRRFSVERMVEGYTDLYEQVLAGR